MERIQLSDGVVRQLCVQAREGSSSARDRLLQGHLGLIIHVARYFFRPHAFLEMDDLIQQGRLGLLRAIEKFDIHKYVRGKRVRFSTYAHFWISHSIRREIENKGRTVAVPIKRLCALKLTAPADLWFEDEEGQALARLVSESDSPDQWCRAWEARREVEFLLSHLSEKADAVLRHRYGLNAGKAELTQKQVGEKLHFSGTQAGLVERAALKALRAFAECRRFPFVP